MREDPEGRMFPFHGECPYLQLLDAETKQCRPFDQVSCNDRQEIKNPCELSTCFIVVVVGGGGGGGGPFLSLCIPAFLWFLVLLLVVVLARSLPSVFLFFFGSLFPF